MVVAKLGDGLAFLVGEDGFHAVVVHLGNGLQRVAAHDGADGVDKLLRDRVRVLQWAA